MIPFGRYELAVALGRGRIMEAFKAKSFGVEGFEKALVVKRVHAELADDADFVEAFIRYAELALRLSHANVVQVFDSGRIEQAEGGGYFLATEFVNGIDLASLFAQCKSRSISVPAPLSVYVAAEVAKALDHAHRRRDEQLRPLDIVHGDIAPSNVLLSWEGEVKVSDFCVALALAKGTSEASRERRKLLNPYASPELLRAEPADAAADLFGLGSILFEALSGNPPSPGEVPASLPSRGEIQAELAALVNRARAATPAQRFESAAALYEALLMQVYRMRARFGAEQLAAFLADFRQEAPQAPEEIGEALAQPRPATIWPKRMGIEQPSRTRSWPPLKEQRDVTALVIEWQEGPDEPTKRHAKNVLARYGGRVAEETDHELGALFGVSHADGRDTENAIRCALLVRRAASSTPASIGAASTRLSLRGSDGSEEERARALLDSARSLARAHPGKVAVSDSCGEQLTGWFELQRSETAPSAWVIGASRPVSESPHRFVGRGQVLSELADRIAAAAQGRARVIGVIGEQGIGKSRLLRELERRIKKSGVRIGFTTAECPPHGREAVRSGIAAMLRAFLGVDEWDATQRLVTLEPELRASGLTDIEVAAVLAELGGAPQDPMSDAEAVLDSAVTRLLGKLSSETPHVLAWDDAQELDVQSAGVLGNVAERASGARLVFLFFARTDADASFQQITGYERVVLAPLAADEAEQLVAECAGVEKVPAALMEFIEGRAGGHPMFIVELLREALESAAIAVEHAEIRQLRLDGALAVPRPLRSLLADRVRRLPQEEQDLVVCASVLGAPADVAVLARMLEAEVGLVQTLVDRLDARTLLRRQGPMAVGFPTPLLPEVVVGDLEPDQIEQLHRVAADAYENVLGFGIEEVVGRAARHHAAAGNHERAAALYAQSGLSALGAGRPERAAHDLMQALKLTNWSARDADQLLAWLAGIADAVRHAKGDPNLPALLLRIGTHVQDAQGIEERRRARLLIELGHILTRLSHYRDARRMLQAAQARSEPWPELVRAALVAEAEIDLEVGEFGAAVERLDGAQAVTAEAEPAEEQRLLIAMARALGGAGEHASAYEILAEAERRAKPDDRASACARARVQALIAAYQGDWEGSADAAARAAALARSALLHYEVAAALQSEGAALLRAGNPAQAYAVLRSALESSEQIGSERLSNFNRLMLAYLDGLNEEEGAVAALGARLEVADERKWLQDAIGGRYLLGKLLARRSEQAAARRELELALKLAVGAGYQQLAGECTHELGTL